MSDKRIEHFRLFVDNTLKPIVQERVNAHLKSNRISTTILLSQLTDTICASLRCEREDYIKDINERFEMMTTERNHYKNAYENLKKDYSKDKSYLMEENTALRKRVEDLELSNKALKWKNIHQNEEIGDTVSKKDDQIAKLKVAMISAKNHFSTMKNDLRVMKYDIQKQFSKQTKLTNKIHNVVLDSISSSVVTKNVIDSVQSQLKKARNQVVEEHNKYLDIRNTLSSMVESLISIAPGGFANSIDIDSLTSNADAIQGLIQKVQSSLLSPIKAHKQSPGKHSTSSILSISMDEIEAMKTVWKENKRELDLKMEELKRSFS